MRRFSFCRLFFCCLLPMNRILIVKMSSMGDVVHAQPLATDLRAQFPDARIEWIV